MNWSVGKKIGAGFCVPLVALVCIGIAGYRTTDRLLENSRWVTHTEIVLRELEAIISHLRNIQLGQRDYLITADDSVLQPFEAAVTGLTQQVDALRGETRDNPKQQQRLDELAPIIAQRIETARKSIELRRSTSFEEARQEFEKHAGRKFTTDILRIVADMEAEENALLKVRTDETNAAAASAKLSIVAGSLATMALLLGAGFLLTRDIARPLDEVSSVAARIARGDVAATLALKHHRSDEVGVLMQTFARMGQSLRDTARAAKQIAGGDLTTRIKPQSADDLLGNAFAAMTENLRGLIGDLVEAVNVLATTATEIMASTSQLAAGAAQTAAAVTETTATVEEVKQTAQVSSEKARFVSDQAQKAVDVAQGGKRSVGQTIEGMNGIRQQMGAVAESILSLSAQSRAISEIIATVDDLASQSKLLAVNASIEAAKAGDEGKGFSVVAQEVKSLAEQSKQATTQVRTILNDIQKATSSAVYAAEQGSKAVESGVQQSTTAGDSIASLADGIASAAQAATQIAATSQQQSVGMDQVALAMENIRNASAQTLASTKQAETAAQQLHALGTKLKDLAAHFKV